MLIYLPQRATPVSAVPVPDADKTTDKVPPVALILTTLLNNFLYFPRASSRDFNWASKSEKYLETVWSRKFPLLQTVVGRVCDILPYILFLIFTFKLLYCI